ncbi:hypothetical protein D3C85_1762970 [compost metagenome]
MKKADVEVLHFAQARQGLMPGGAIGQLEVLKGMTGALTNRGNSNVEDYYTGHLSGFIADDLRGIPSR